MSALTPPDGLRLPLHCGGTEGQDRHCMYGADDRFVALSNPLLDDEGDAFAAYLVACANAGPELVAMLYEAIGTHGEPCPDANCSFKDRARALLAKIDGAK